MFLRAFMIMFLIISGISSGYGLDADSLNQYQDTESYPEGESETWLLYFLLAFIMGALVIVGIGIVIALIAIFIVFALVAVGVLSASVIVGMYNRSFSSGFKTFLIIVSTIVSPGFFAVVFLGFNAVVHWWSKLEALLIGGIFGLVTGVAFGFSAYYITKWVLGYLKERLGRQVAE